LKSLLSSQSDLKVVGDLGIMNTESIAWTEMKKPSSG